MKNNIKNNFNRNNNIHYAEYLIKEFLTSEPWLTSKARLTSTRVFD